VILVFLGVQEIGMTSKSVLLASSALAALLFTGSAEARGMYYFTAGGGANWFNDDSFHARTSPTNSAETLNFAPSSDVGFVLHATVGAHLDQIFNGLRIEAEGSYRRANVNGNWTSNTGTPTDVSAGNLDFDESVWAILGNVWWDINLGSSLTPYIGGGAGYGESKLEGTFKGATPSGAPNFKLTDDGFAWQLGAGVNWQIGPNVAIGVGYRYFVAPSVDVRPPGFAYFPNDARGTVDVNSQSVLLDFTFAM
jgi:opacity protein-like surface antigen